MRLVIQLEDRIEELTAMHVSAPQISIRRLTNHIKRLQQTLDNKNAELTHTHQLIVQLQARIRELEKSLEEGAAEPVPVIKRDSHNSNQPPALDLPWVKPKRTRSLRKQSGLKVGGQLGHPGVTLKPVAAPNRIIEHSVDDCSQCGASLVPAEPSRFFRRQAFKIENGSLAVVEHRTLTKLCPACGSLSKGQIPCCLKSAGAVRRERDVSCLVSAFVSAFAGRQNAGSDARSVRVPRLTGFDRARCAALFRFAHQM